MATISGGDKLKAALDKIAAKLNKPGTLRVGFLKGATAPNGDSLPLRAALNEFGVPSRNQPPRPFFRNMVAAKNAEWAPAIAGLLKNNGYDTTKALNLAGMGISDQLKQSIRDLTSPPLSPVTVKRKGFDKPLIEHGDMLNAASFEVKS